MVIKSRPLTVYPLPGDDTVTPPGGGWGGMNKPKKVQDAEGNIWVAKSNDFGANPRQENIHEVVTSHLLNDELDAASLTFREGELVVGEERFPKILSPLRTDFRTLEKVPVSAVKDGDAAVRNTILASGLMGDWDSTGNNSNVWVLNDGTFMGADFGYAALAGNSKGGVPYGNVKILKKFATEENLEETTDFIKNLSDEKIHEMVDRVGQTWIHDWTPEMEQDIASAMIHNRDEIRKQNLYTRYLDKENPKIDENWYIVTTQGGTGVWEPTVQQDQVQDSGRRA